MKAAQGGYTLIEVTVAMLITALVASGMFSVLLASRTNQVFADRRQAGAIYAQRARDRLREWVGAYVGSADQYALVCGRSTTCDGGSVPRLLGDLCADAFTVGCVHNADSLLPSWFTAAPFNAVMCYTVANETVGGDAGRPLKKVEITVKWRRDETDAPIAGCP